MESDRAGYMSILDRVWSPLLVQWETTFGGGHISSIELIGSQPTPG